MTTSPESTKETLAPVTNLYSQTLKRRGKHKIFIGMAPGVGKTYRMLEEGA